jgi:hypothetical protein
VPAFDVPAFDAVPPLASPLEPPVGLAPPRPLDPPEPDCPDEPDPACPLVPPDAARSPMTRPSSLHAPMPSATRQANIPPILSDSIMPYRCLQMLDRTTKLRKNPWGRFSVVRFSGPRYGRNA